MNTAPANYIHLTIYGDFDNKIYEETQEPSNERGLGKCTLNCKNSNKNK